MLASSHIWAAFVDYKIPRAHINTNVCSGRNVCRCGYITGIISTVCKTADSVREISVSWCGLNILACKHCECYCSSDTKFSRNSFSGFGDEIRRHTQSPRYVFTSYAFYSDRNIRYAAWSQQIRTHWFWECRVGGKCKNALGLEQERQCTLNVEARSGNRCCRGKTVNVTFLCARV